MTRSIPSWQLTFRRQSIVPTALKLTDRQPFGSSRTLAGRATDHFLSQLPHRKIIRVSEVDRPGLVRGGRKTDLPHSQNGNFHLPSMYLPRKTTDIHPPLPTACFAGSKQTKPKPVTRLPRIIAPIVPLIVIAGADLHIVKNDPDEIGSHIAGIGLRTLGQFAWGGTTMYHQKHSLNQRPQDAAVGYVQ